ncbi:DUF6684 family protein [Haloplanus sp. GCM10025708]|uniref:DUF6684 family protein n=1 Tax=Haloferacaceae TaxID=1644056 RepID=UPI00362445D5
MTTRIFDRETILDLTVNFIPLAIILFFVVGYAVVNPFGWDPLASGLQFALLVVPFALLAVLTYLSGKAISQAEDERPVYLPGQATVSGAEPIEERESEGAIEGDAGGES